jgi:hypothetical protein
MEDRGFDTPADFARNQGDCLSRAAIGAAVPSGNARHTADSLNDDPLLDRFLIAWQALTEGDRLIMVQQAERLAETGAAGWSVSPAVGCDANTGM